MTARALQLSLRAHRALAAPALLACSALLAPAVQAQDVTLLTQSDVDAFSDTSIAGDLTIGPSSGADPIRNIDSLRGVTSVGGHVNIIANAELLDINGLSGLKSVGGDLRINGNPPLSQLHGLSALTSVGGDLVVKNHAALSSLADYCGLFPLLDGGGLAGTATFTNNGLNPTVGDILAAGPCTPRMVIGDLLQAGKIHWYQALVLRWLTCGSSSSWLLRYVLSYWVRWGSMTHADAQLLLVVTRL